MTVAGFLNQVGVGIVTSLIVGAIIAVFGYAVPPIRYWMFCKTIQYRLECPESAGGRTWDIQWEDLRLTIEVAKPHNDYLEGVTLKLNKQSPGHQIDHMNVSRQFVMPERWRLHVKLASIIREKSPNDSYNFVIHFVVRRPRW